MAKIDPIDRAAVIDTLRNCLETKWFGSIEASMHYRDSIEFAMSCINAAPTLDVQPLRHGKWIFVCECVRPYETEIEERCSECGRYVQRYSTQPQDIFCPCCGAKMDKD